MSGTDWTVITVTYNSAPQLRAAWQHWDRNSARWIVVDNGSADDSVDVARRLGAEVIETRTNVGFGPANNLALAATSSRWVLFANPDLAVDATDLPRLASVADANAALVAPQLVNADGTQQPNARGLPHLADKVANRSGWWPGVTPTDYARTGLPGPTHIAWAIGAAVAGERALLQELGGWDERYFIYYEDHDLGLRSWLRGRSVVLDPAVRWNHQWQRATTAPRLTPWRHELRSMRVFYGEYPELLTRRRSRGARRWDELRARLWTPAADPGAG